MPDRDDETYEHTSFLTHKVVTTHSGGSSALYHCELCDKSFAEALLGGHCRSKSHVSRVKQIQRMQKSSTVRKSAAYQTRIDQLGLGAWQADVQLKLYWILLYQDISERPQVLELKAAVETMLCKYECLERISLLELAVWKAVCIIAPPPPLLVSPPASVTALTKKRKVNPPETRAIAATANVTTAVKYDYHTWQEWLRQGWKSSKGTMRNANEIGIIITSVLPFLTEKPKATVTTATVATVAAETVAETEEES